MARKGFKAIFQVKNRFGCALLLALALQCCIVSSAPARGGKQVAVWELRQEISGWGQHTVWINESAIRIDDPLRHFSVLAKAPDWTVIHYSTIRKNISFEPLATYDGGLAHRMSIIGSAFVGSENPDKLKGWERSGNEMYCGQNCEKWTVQKKIAAARGVGAYKILEAPDIRSSTQACKILASQMSLPSFGHVSLFFQKGHNKPMMAFGTRSTRKTSVPSSFFEIPKDYARTTPEKVMFDRQEFDF